MLIRFPTFSVVYIYIQRMQVPFLIAMRYLMYIYDERDSASMLSTRRYQPYIDMIELHIWPCTWFLIGSPVICAIRCSMSLSIDSSSVYSSGSTHAVLLVRDVEMCRSRPVYQPTSISNSKPIRSRMCNVAANNKDMVVQVMVIMLHVLVAYKTSANDAANKRWTE